MNLNKTFPILLSMILMHSTKAYAEIIPDAGIIQRGLDSSRPQTPSSDPVLPRAENEEEDDPNVAHFKIEQISIQGATLIDSKILESLVHDKLGQLLSAKQIQKIGLKLSDYYRSQGWLARVVFPEQDLHSGTLIVNILESVYRGNELDALESRADSELLEQLAVGDLVSGEALSLQSIESGVLKANDQPGIRTTAVLVPGEASGETKLKLKLTDSALISGNLSYSNQGIRSTGSNQYQGNINFNNPLGRADQFSVQALGSENMFSVRGQYGWLLNRFGSRFSIYGSQLHYELGGNFANLQAEGEGRVLGGIVNHPLIRRSEENLYASISIENRLNQSSQLGSLSRLRDINLLALAISADKTDHLLGLAQNNAGLQLNLGHLNIDLENERQSDQQTVRAAGDFFKLSFNLIRTEYFNDNWNLSLAFSGQWAAKNLDSSQKFSLGGPSGVRAFPVNEGMGDSGCLLTAELRRQLGYGFQGMIFADTGAVEVNHGLWMGSGTQHNQYILAGVGLGLRWNYQQEWQASATVGLPVTTNPAKDIYNHNGDGTRAGDPAGWLSLTRFF